MEFTSWDAGLRSCELEHHGIPGMKWGVRRYQNADGSLTIAGQRRYGMTDTGAGGQKRTSARKMQRDWNNLDKGYANVVAERNAARQTSDKYYHRANRRMEKLHSKGKDFKNDKKVNRLAAKSVKAAKKYMLNDKQMKEIEALQNRILAKAHQNGYTTKSKAVVRLGNTARQRGLASAANVLIGGGAVGGAVTGAILGSKAVRVDGQKVKIRKKGDGSTQMVNYAPLNEEERRRRRNG